MAAQLLISTIVRFCVNHLLMPMQPVKIYGLFGQPAGVTLDLEEDVLLELAPNDLLELQNRSYIVLNILRNGKGASLNLQECPNPHLYSDQRRRFSTGAGFANA